MVYSFVCLYDQIMDRNFHKVGDRPGV